MGAVGTGVGAVGTGDASGTVTLAIVAKGCVLATNAKQMATRNSFFIIFPSWIITGDTGFEIVGGCTLLIHEMMIITS